MLGVLSMAKIFFVHRLGRTLAFGKRSGTAAALALAFSPLLAGCESQPDDAFAAARLAYNRSSPRTAMEHIERALDARPEDARVAMLAGDIALALGNAERAVSMFERASSTEDPSSIALAKLAEAQIMANYLSAAEKTLASLRYDVPLAYTAAIAFSLAKGDLDTAYARLKEGLAKFPDDPRLVTIDAERLWDNGQPLAAARRLAPVLEHEPAIAQAQMLGGRMAMSRRALDEASARFTAALNVQPANQTAMLALAAIAHDRGNPDEAANWINKANSAGSPHPVGLLFAAQMAYNAGEIERAFELIETVPQGLSNTPSFARLRGLIDAARGQYGTAVLPLRDYLEQASDDYLARRMLAESHAQIGEFGNAWSTIRPVLDDPQADEGALALALALAERAGSSEVPRIRSLLEQRASRPTFDRELVAAGEAIRAGNWKEADAIYAPLVDGAGKRDAVLLNNAAAVKSNLGEHEAAIALARRALQLAPRSAQVLDTLGWALWQSGQKRDEARTLLAKARQAAPGNTEIARHYAVAAARDTEGF